MKLTTLLFLILINMSCNSTKNKVDKKTDVTDKKELKTDNQSMRKRMLISLVNAQTGGFEKPQIRVVKDQEGLQEIYGQINKTRKPGFAMPKVDFTKQTIVGVFMGTKNSGGYHVEVQKFETSGKRLILKVKETAPKPMGMVTMVMSQPFCIVIVNNADKELVFEKI